MVRIIRNGNGFELVKLEDTAVRKLVTKLLDRNTSLMKRCMKKTVKLLSRTSAETSPQACATIASALFRSVAQSRYGVEQDALTEYVNHIKNNHISGPVQSKDAAQEVGAPREVCEGSAPSGQGKCCICGEPVGDTPSMPDDVGGRVHEECANAERAPLEINKGASS